jgi:RimJ/RimL family protein N-acetyltransferase
MSLIEVKNDHQSHQQNLGSFYMNSCPSWFKTQEDLNESLLNPKHELYYVQTDQKHIATSLIIAQDEPSQRWIIWSVCTNPGMRRQGHASRAIRWSVAAWAKRHPNVPHIYLYVEKQNLAAFHVYTKLGFKQVPPQIGTFYSQLLEGKILMVASVAHLVASSHKSGGFDIIIL